MHRPSVRLLLVGTVIGAAVLGSSFRADATPAQQRMLASRAQTATAADVTLPAGFQQSIAFDGLAFPTAVRFSPDGRWVAYNSDESGRMEVYVRPFAGGGGRVQISVAGGQRAVLQRALLRAGGNVSAAAKALGVSRATLHRKLNRFGLNAH